MFGFLTPARSEAADPLTNAAAAQAFWQALPEDALAAQAAVCKVLADAAGRASSSADRLQALLLFDQRARMLVDALLVHDVGESANASSSPGRAWQAAFDLCRAFGRAYGHLLRLMRDNGEFENHREFQSLVVLRLFRQRQLELLLRPFTDDRAPAFSWREIHDAYKFADAKGLLREAVPVKRNPEAGGVETRLEREYVHVLMQDLMNGGQFPPFEASWVNQRIPRWCLAMTLQPDEGEGPRFVVDPNGDAGLARASGESTDATRALDMTPLLKSIAAQMVSLRDTADRPGQNAMLGRGRQLRVLQKVSALCTPQRPVVERRGERRPVAMTVEIAIGLPRILRRVRGKPEDLIAAMPAASAGVEGMTIAGFGPSSQDPPSAFGDGMNTVMQLPGGASSPAQLTVVDESDTGCRLQGPALPNNPTIPGALIAIRQDAASPWTLAVMRRVKKRLAGRRVEIGAEYLGKAPRWVVVIAGTSDGKAGKASVGEPARFAGLYLPETARLPIKTLVLPSCGLAAGDHVEVRSRTSSHKVRLKEPLDEQADFIWAPFEILDRQA